MAGTWDLMPVAARTVDYAYPSATASSDERLWFNEARHLWCFHDETLGWLVAASLTPSFKVSDVVLSAVPNLFYAGREVFAGTKSDGSDPHVLFYSPYHGWWIYRSGSTVAEPRSYKDLDGSTKLGDAWYSTGILPYPGHGDTYLEAEGTIEGQAYLTLSLFWPRWKRRSGDRIVNDSAHPVRYSPCGVYQAVDQTAADIVIGVPYWRDEHGNLYQRSASKDENGNWVYGAIGKTDGYWAPDGASYPRSASEPSRDSPVDFFDEDGKKALTLTFYGLGTGAQVAVRYFGEACVWRA